MYLDIPECETWVWKEVGTSMNDYAYYSGRAHSPVNKYVASGSFLSGNNIVSCEELTNVGYIFQASLEELKIAGDMSNLSGVNHSILHGFNYSPENAIFPGWIKFGTYFSEHNTWWPYVHYWMDYKARLSALFQNSVLQADIAILPPFEDLWSRHGQQREPFPTLFQPDYTYNLCEALHQSGNGCDYISERIICEASIQKRKTNFWFPLL